MLLTVPELVIVRREKPKSTEGKIRWKFACIYLERQKPADCPERTSQLASHTTSSWTWHGLPLVQLNRRRHRRYIAESRVEASETAADGMEWRFFTEGVIGNTAQELSFLQWKKGQRMQIHIWDFMNFWNNMFSFAKDRPEPNSAI